MVKNILAILGLIFLYMVKITLLDAMCFDFCLQGVNYQWLQAAIYMRVAFAIVCASVACIGRKYTFPTILLMVILDIWIVANILYYRFGNLFLNWEIIREASNLRGFESSILPLLSWKLLILPVTTILGAIFVRSFAPTQSWKWFVSLGGLVILFVGISLVERLVYLQDRYHSKPTASLCTIMSLPEPMSDVVFYQEEDATYIKLNSIGLFLIRECYHSMKKEATPLVSLTEEEQEILQERLQPKVPQNPVQGHLLFILLESFESWLLDERDAQGDWVCPNLNAWIAKHPVLISRRMHSEQGYGQSGDGQLILMTGLLPLRKGVACNEYGRNVYPNFAHFYDDAFVVNPWRGTWNQDVVSYSYGFKRVIQSTEPDPMLGEDEVVFDITRRELAQAVVPTCALAISISMHIPFTRKQLDVDVVGEKDELTSNYIRSARYTDSALAPLLAWIDTAECMQNATIVITADHFILSGTNGIPFIVRSPTIENTRELTEQTYHKDVFSTVLHAIGQQNYYFRGLGEDLLADSVSYRTEHWKLHQLSEKLIHVNYFADKSPNPLQTTN